MNGTDTRTVARSRGRFLPSQFVRSAQAVVFIGIWMAIGWLFHLDANSYLVVGVPLVVHFQLLVRKKPLVTLWIRDAERFRLNLWGMFWVLPGDFADG